MSQNPRRRIIWSNINNTRARSALLIATAGCVGLLPIAPGTFGSLASLPIAYFIASWSLLGKLTLWLGISAIGTWAAKVFDEVNSTSDNQNIVIDEVVGIGIAALSCSTILDFSVAFFLFRFFDILKPFPVRQIDKWSKLQASKANGNRWSGWWGGFGVIADDIGAGIQALSVILLLQHFGVLT